MQSVRQSAVAAPKDKAMDCRFLRSGTEEVGLERGIALNWADAPFRVSAYICRGSRLQPPSSPRTLIASIWELSPNQLGKAVVGLWFSFAVAFFVLAHFSEAKTVLDKIAIVCVGTIIYGLGYYLAYNLEIHSSSKVDARIGALYSWIDVASSFGEDIYHNRDQPLRQTLRQFNDALRPVQTPVATPPEP